MYPGVKVLRDFQIARDEEARYKLLISEHKPDLIPDVLVFFPKEDGKKRVVIAVEVERSRKANNRVTEKLWRITTKTMLDGVLYDCSYDSIATAYKHLYNSRVREKFLRVNDRKNYLMFGRHDHLLFNCNGERADLRSWIEYLLSTSTRERQDAHFPPSA